MVYVVWERMQRAHWCRLFRWVARSAVILGEARDDHLRVALGAKRTALKQWRAKVYAAAVNVQARLHVVQRVDYQICLFPECVVEDALRVR